MLFLSGDGLVSRLGGSRAATLRGCKLAALEREKYASGAMPKIHVSVGALAASRPQAPVEYVSGD